VAKFNSGKTRSEWHTKAKSEIGVVCKCESQKKLPMSGRVVKEHVNKVTKKLEKSEFRASNG
jgi:hypothetical protein